MLKKLMTLLLTALLGCTSALAEFPEFENQIPKEPLITENDAVTVTAEYDSEHDCTLYTIALKDAAQFPDGSALTADDLIFTWYVYLDPGYTGNAKTAQLPIPGLESYRMQASENALANARAAAAAIEAAGADHVWSESDRWTSALQEAFWAQKAAYDEACKAEYPKCVQSIVNLCSDLMATEGTGAFGMTAEEIAADEGLCVAYAMMTWGYAEWDGSLLTSTRTRTAWLLSAGEAPTVDDFIAELKAVYGNDLAACWAVETTGAYAPALPDWQGEFLKIAVTDSTVVSAVTGIRRVDAKTVQVELPGIDMRSEGALLGVPLMSLKRFGDAAQWDPEAGRYGHGFGDVSAIEAALAADGGAHTIELVKDADGEFFQF